MALASLGRPISRFQNDRFPYLELRRENPPFHRYPCLRCYTRIRMELDFLVGVEQTL